jgi:glycosyltransferase
LCYVNKSDSSIIVRRWASSSFKKSFLKQGWMPPHPTLYVRKEWYRLIGGFDTNYRISADYLSILQLFSFESFKAIHLPRVLIKMRIGGISNNSIKNILLKMREDYRAIKSKKIGGIFTLFLKNFLKLPQLKKICKK